MSERLAPQSFSLNAGETVLLAFTADGDISGATVRFWMARRRGGTVVVSTEAPLLNALGTITVSPEFTVTIEDDDTEDLIGTYVYEIELEDIFGDKTKAAQGYLTFLEQIT